VTPPLPVRIAVLVAVGLLAAAVAADLYGAKTEARFSGAVSPAGGDAVVVAVLAATSGGVVELRLEGHESAYYFKIRGSPLKALSQVSTLGVRLENERFTYDVRAGFGYGDAIVIADPALIASLPLLASGSGSVGELPPGEAVLVERLSTGEGLAVIALPGGDGIVRYEGVFRVEGYDRLSALEALAVAAAIAGVPALAWAALGGARGWLAGRLRW